MRRAPSATDRAEIGDGQAPYGVVVRGASSGIDGE